MTWARRVLAAVVLLLATVLARPARATPPSFAFEESGVATPQRNSMVAAFDAQAMLGLQVHYLRRLPGLLWGNALLVGGGVELPLMLWIRSGVPDTARFDAHVIAQLGRWRWFGISAELDTRLGVQRDVLGTRTSWDMVLRAMPGFHFGRGSVGLDLGWQQGLATHVRPSDYVRDAFELGGAPAKGWVATPATRFPLGLHGSGRVAPRVSIVVSAGLVLTPTKYSAGLFDTMMVGVWPFFADLGVSWRF